MQFRFIGQYTNGHTSITTLGVCFEGHAPSEVPAEHVDKFARHPEFEAVDAVDKTVRETLSIVTEPKRRGRPRKVSE